MALDHQVCRFDKSGYTFVNAEKLALEEIARPPGLTDFRLKNEAAIPAETGCMDGIITGFDMKFRE